MTNLETWLVGDATFVGYVLVSTILVYVAVTVMVRLLGLRSFAKMSSTDFVTTVAIGSLMANIISAPSPSVAIGLASLVSLFLLKYTVATTRRHFELARQLLDNKPAYLMDGPNINHDALSEHHISVEELHAKLRQANVWSYEQVICVVLAFYSPSHPAFHRTS